MSYRVLCNGRFIGIVESNYHWASAYWAKQCREDVTYKLERKNDENA